MSFDELLMSGIVRSLFRNCPKNYTVQYSTGACSPHLASSRAETAEADGQDRSIILDDAYVVGSDLHVPVRGMNRSSRVLGEIITLFLSRTICKVWEIKKKTTETEVVAGNAWRGCDLAFLVPSADK